MEPQDQRQGLFNYHHELATLIRLVKSETQAGGQAIQVLKSGDETAIRDMLRNFGNPEHARWRNINSALPWSDWQIDQAVKDINAIKPDELADPYFWAW